MSILIGLAVGAGLLYYWLIGHWFARVLMVPVFAIPLGLVIGLAMVSGEHSGPHDSLVGILIGCALAWPISGIPRYFHRWHFNRTTQLRLGVPFN